MELFFDLVFVFAVTQLSHYLLEHHTLAGVLQTAVMFIAVWWAWIYTAWATNWLDPDRAEVRLMLIVVMLLSLVLSSTIPGAFGPYGIHFSIAYIALQLTRTLYTAWAKGEWKPGISKNLTRASLYFVAAAPLWIAGGLNPDPGVRLLCWLGALVIEYLGPSLYFAVPGLGRSTIGDWNISGGHMAERCSLFIIISLGEGVLVTGATFSTLEPSAAAVAAFLSAFIASVAMWWIYFDIGFRRGTEAMEHQQEPGLVAREAYTYGHIPIVAGIIVLAVADEQALMHPVGHTEPLLLGTLVGGGFLFIGGTMIFKKMVSVHHRFPLSHLVGLALFAALGVWGYAAHPSPLALHSAATVLFLLIAVWEWGSYHGGWLKRWARLRRSR